MIQLINSHMVPRSIGFGWYFKRFRNDSIVAESHRIKIFTDAEGRSHYRLSPALAFDQGMYKIVARNKIGQTITRTRVVLGLVPDEPDSPEASQVSDTEVLLLWKQPKHDGNSPVICYRWVNCGTSKRQMSLILYFFHNNIYLDWNTNWPMTWNGPKKPITLTMSFTWYPGWSPAKPTSSGWLLETPLDGATREYQLLQY